MINKFEDGKTYIFDMSTYLGNDDSQTDIIESYWVQECNQKTVNVISEKQGCIVINGTLYSIVPNWCKEKIYEVRKLEIDDIEGEP